MPRWAKSIWDLILGMFGVLSLVALVFWVVSLIESEHHPLWYWLVASLACLEAATLIWGARRGSSREDQDIHVHLEGGNVMMGSSTGGVTLEPKTPVAAVVEMKIGGIVLSDAGSDRSFLQIYVRVVNRSDTTFLHSWHLTARLADKELQADDVGPREPAPNRPIRPPLVGASIPSGETDGLVFFPLRIDHRRLEAIIADPGRVAVVTLSAKDRQNVEVTTELDLHTLWERGHDTSEVNERHTHDI